MIRILLVFMFTITSLFALDTQKTYTIAFLKDWKPYYITNKNDKPDGYVYELFEAVSKKTNLKFKYKIVNNWKEVYPLAKNGEIDIVPNLGITRDRENLFLFTQPTDTFKIRFFKRKDSIDIKNKEGLKKKKVGVQVTNVCNELLTNDITNNKIIVDSFSILLTKLSSGELDVICYPESLMINKLKELGLNNKIIPFEEPIKEIKRGMAVTKENFDLLPILDENITEIKIDRSFQKIYSKWFGEKEKVGVEKETFEKFLIALAILIFVMLFIIIWNNKLKKEYRKQKELKEKLKSAQKIAKLGHFTFYFKENIFTCSNEIDRIFGIEENSEKTVDIWLDIIHPEDQKRVKEYWTEATSEKTDFELEYRIINKKTKKTIWVHGLGRIVRDAEFNSISMFGTVQDINERKKTEEQLNQAMMVFENTHDGIVITDKETRIINVNKSFENTTGYKLEEVINKKPNILRADENDNNFYEKLWTELNTKGVWSGEIRNKNKNDKTYDEILTINAIYDSNNKVNGYIGIFTDITKQKSDEQMLITQSKVAAIGEMLGNISHQWRQPLSVITTHATGLKLSIEFGSDDLSDEKLIKSMDEINFQAQYLSKTIDDFRNFFKNDSHTVHKFSIKEAFKKLDNLTKDSLNNNYIKYESKIMDIDLVRNENLFIQALINIYNNAKDAMVENQKDSDCRYLFIETKLIEDNFEIKIKDTGGGISPHIVDKIFDPYFTTKHQSIGTGIGLYMTHQIISKQFEGKIIVQNVTIERDKKVLKGTEFKLILPISEKHEKV